MTSQDALGGRLSLVDPAGLTDAQQKLFDYVIATQLPWANENGFRVTTTDGRVIGPFNSFLRRPEVALKFLEFAAAEHRCTSLSEGEREAVIVSVGGLWDAEYELYAHKILARNGGLTPEAITALENGTIPDGLTEREKIAARVTQQLTTRHRIDDALYRQATETFGEPGMYDIAAVMGQYMATSVILTLFMVAVPDPE
jgi:4-carboxymuconolactone decarboxylase